MSIHLFYYYYFTLLLTNISSIQAAAFLANSCAYLDALRDEKGTLDYNPALPTALINYFVIHKQLHTFHGCPFSKTHPLFNTATTTSEFLATNTGLIKYTLDSILPIHNKSLPRPTPFIHSECATDYSLLMLNPHVLPT